MQHRTKNRPHAMRPGRARPARPRQPARPPARRRPARAGLAALALGALTALAAAGCAHTPPDPATAVDVVIDNRSDWNVTVQAVRSGGIVDFQQTVPRHGSERALVRHAAFGHGRVAFRLVAGRGTFARVYAPANRVEIPEGATVLVSLGPRIEDSTVQVHAPPVAGRADGAPVPARPRR